MIKLDPLSAFAAAGSSLVGRMACFMFSGMAGSALGWVAQSFRAWQDFFHPVQTVIDNIEVSSSGEALMWLAMWPIIALGTMVRPWFFIPYAFFAALIFILMIYSEEPPRLWCYLLVMATSLVPLMNAFDLSKLSMWVVLAALWLPILYLSFAAWRADYGGVVSVTAEEEDVEE
ncbi:MAG: hypothetical protein L3J39_06105 [Verrucomicrobiales bacterium]|nr:hypothetical protein [Verrucomicrobiales bacterium]